MFHSIDGKPFSPMHTQISFLKLDVYFEEYINVLYVGGTHVGGTRYSKNASANKINLFNKEESMISYY